MLALAPSFDGRRTIPSKEVTDIMLEMLALTPEDKVLEIGTGSGYQTQRLADTGAEVHSIELEPWVDSTVITGECVFLHTGDGKDGLPTYGPFTAIVATCGVRDVPRAWLDQLAPGGRIVCPVGDESSQRLVLFTLGEGGLQPRRVAAYVRFQMMREKPVPKPPKYQAYGEN